MPALSVLVSGLVTALAVAARGAVVAGRRQAVVRNLTISSRREGPEAPTWRRDAAGGWVARLPPPPRWVAAALADGAVDADHRLVWSAWLALTAMVGLAAAVEGGPALAALAAGAAVGGSSMLLRSRRGRDDARVEQALPDALEAVARSLRSGSSLRQAVDDAARCTPGALGAELARVSRAAAHGAPLVAALDHLARRRPLPGLRLGMAALCLGAETGGAQARAVDGVAATLRDRLGVAAEVRALSAQARASALVIALAPVAFCAFASATDPRSSQFLFHTPAGLAVVAAGLTLDGLGAAWTRRLSRIEA